LDNGKSGRQDLTAVSSVVVTDTSYLFFGEITGSSPFAGTTGARSSNRRSITLLSTQNLCATGVKAGIVGTFVQSAVVVDNTVWDSTVLFSIHLTTTAIGAGSTRTEIVRAGIIRGTGTVIDRHGYLSFST